MNSKLNILFIAFDYKPNLGGVAEYTHELARHLFISGHKVKVIAKKINGWEEFDRQVDFEIIRADCEPSKKLYTRFRFFNHIYSLIKNDGYSVAIVNYPNSFGMYSSIALRLKRIPVILFTYGNEVLLNGSSPRSVRKDKFIYSMVKRFLTISSFTREVLLKERYIPAEKIGIVSPGINTEIFIEEKVVNDTGDNEKIVLTVTRLVERKGIDTVLKAFPAVLERVPEAEYVVIGDGPDKDRLQEITRTLGLQGKVRFLGQVSEKEKFEWYDRCSLFIMPSRRTQKEVEGFGIVFLEANARKKPVIGGNSGGQPDAVSHGESGYLVDPLDEVEISERIVELLEDEELAAEMGEKGWQRARDKFLWSDLAKLLEKELYKVVPDGR